MTTPSKDPITAPSLEPALVRSIAIERCRHDRTVRGYLELLRSPLAGEAKRTGWERGLLARVLELTTEAE